MDSLEPFGRSLVILGVVLAAIGAVFILGPRLPILGKLPGDITIVRDGWTIYIPFTTMILVSIVASVVLGILNRR